jgi:NADPH-dependent 2,4-dienoyl-CoA reductase/sulfur reductase-like enzyme
LSAACDVAIIGAGPAGLAAAEVLCGRGLHVAIIDEQQRAGGQFLRQPPASFSVDRWLTAEAYRRARATLDAMQARTDIDWRLGTIALGILRRSGFRNWQAADGGHELWLQGPAGCGRLSARALVLATGCYERPLAFPGWTLPGAMGAGAIQAFVKSQQFVPGKRFVLAGSHPLQLVVADQLLAAGATIAAIVFTQPRSVAAAALRHPLIVMRHRRQFIEVARILRRLRQAGVPVIYGSSIVRAEGRLALDRARSVAADCVGICDGFLASSELARQAGARVHWQEDQGGWTVVHDEWFETNVPKLFVAGEITAVAGADAALEKGRIAGTGVLRALDLIDGAAGEQLATAPRRRLAHLWQFASLLGELARPPANLALEILGETTAFCRCEHITRGEFERQLRENPHVTTADAAKLLTRVGMGLCQGRLCGNHAAQLIARQRRMPIESVGVFHAQAPIKPVPVEAVATDRCC